MYKWMNHINLASHKVSFTILQVYIQYIVTSQTEDSQMLGDVNVTYSLPSLFSTVLVTRKPKKNLAQRFVRAYFFARNTEILLGIWNKNVGIYFYVKFHLETYFEFLTLCRTRFSSNFRAHIWETATVSNFCAA